MPTADRELARAKLTRSFRVIGRRKDGLHEIAAEMVTIDLADQVELSDGDGIEIIDEIAWSQPSAASRPLGDVLATDNLVATALAVVGKRAHVRLTKRIPLGSGLGGGSADAAAVLRWAGVTDLHVAANVGADVPFCLLGGRAKVSGIGEMVDALAPIDLEFVLVVPDVPVSTAAVYAAFDDLGGAGDESVSNDLERAALVVEPRLSSFRDAFAAASGSLPMLAGSGATWFAECTRSESEAIATNVREAILAEGLNALVVTARTSS